MHQSVNMTCSIKRWILCTITFKTMRTMANTGCVSFDYRLSVSLWISDSYCIVWRQYFIVFLAVDCWLPLKMYDSHQATFNCKFFCCSNARQLNSWDSVHVWLLLICTNTFTCPVIANLPKSKFSQTKVCGVQQSANTLWKEDHLFQVFYLLVSDLPRRSCPSQDFYERLTLNIKVL